MPKSALLKPNPAWNRMGPPVPLWFKRALRRLHKRMVVQFTPPRSVREPHGVNPEVYPNGVWDLCVRLPSGYLHPRVVWSLTDAEGNFCMPTADTVHLIWTAVNLQRRNRMDLLEDEMDASIARINKARAERSKRNLYYAIKAYCSKYFGRQWSNRVYLRGS